MRSLKFWKDPRAESAMDMVVGVAVGLIVLAAVFSLAPLIGSKIDDSIVIPDGVSATGTLTVSGNTADAETVTIEGVTFELDTNLTHSEITGGNVEVDIADAASATATLALRNAMNGHTATAIRVTASSTSTTVGLTAVDGGVGGNSIDTTETMQNGAWGAATLTGGSDTGGSPWAADTIPSGVDIWSDNASLLGLVVLVIIIGLAIFYIRNMGGGGGV